MAQNPLHIVSTDTKKKAPASSSKRTEAQAKFEKQWLNNPEQFNPERNCMEIERIKRSIHAIEGLLIAPNAKAVDLGCGAGLLTKKVRDLGYRVTAVDIASRPLQQLLEDDAKNLEVLRDYVPKTLLEDALFDLVIATEIIAYLSKEEYRLFFAETTRLVKKEGHVICSTALDIDSENALERFLELAETELDIEALTLSYHFLYLKIRDFFKAPKSYAQGWKNPEERSRQMLERSSLSRFWYRLNSSKLVGPLWSLFRHLTNPVVTLLNHSPRLLRVLEKISRVLWQERAISHVIIIGRQRPLLPPTVPDFQPEERKHKKQLWE